MACLAQAFECRAASAEEAARWKRSLDAITSRAISGYIQLKGRRGWKRRWVLFQPLCKKLCIYRAQPLLALSAGTFADAHIYQQPGYRALEAEGAFLSPSQRSRGHVLNCTRPYSAGFTVVAPLGIHAVL